MTEHEIIDQFLVAMSEQGLKTTDPIEADGRIHRFHVEGDRKGSKTAWYCLHIDESPAGAFGCHKRHGGRKFSWKAKGRAYSMSPEERAAIRERAAAKRAAELARQAEAAERAAAIWESAKEAPETHPYLKRKGIKPHGLRVGKWEIIDTDTGEVRVISNNALLVPFFDRTRKIHSLQAIFPRKLLGGGTRDKDYLKGGAKIGYFYPIGKPQEREDGRTVFIIAEGFATGASVHEATGHFVLVAFDTANLLPVARAVRERVPDAIILFAADDDRHVTQPVTNPGVTYATLAAKEVDGFVAVPQFANLDGNPTDFNDLHLREGLETVAVQILAAMAPQDEPEPEPELPVEEAPPVAPQAPRYDDEDDENELIKNGYFTILGYDHGNYYVFQHEKRQVLVLTRRDLTDTGLIELAPVNWWEQYFPGEKSIDKKAAANWLFRTANSRGIYDPTKVRGRGAWRDKGRYVFHHGPYLTVDGVQTDITKIPSAYVYPMGKAMPPPAEQMLTDEEGAHLLKVASMVRWSMPASAALMSGWCMLAMISGALRWRPHIWLCGAAGSGKSTVQSDYCYSLVRGIGIYGQGNSTEAGIRQRLRADAVPVLIDEMETNNERERQRVEGILALIRQASTNSQAETLKGTVSGEAMAFHVQSMFCLASINTALTKKADIDRLTRLTIRPPDKSGKDEDQWERLSEELHKMASDETLSSRLLARCLKLLPVIIETIDVFRAAAANYFGSQRDGDQFGTLLAGCWCLMNSVVPSTTTAAAFIGSYDWSEHVEDHDHDDATQALEAVLSAKIRIPQGDVSVYELIRETSTLHRVGSIDPTIAESALVRHGIRPDHAEGLLVFGVKVSNLSDLVKDKPFASDLRGQLLRIKGAKRVKPMRFNGTLSRGVAIPLKPILSEEGGEYGPL